MDEIIFKTELIKGAKGDRGEAGQADSIPTDGVIAFQGETVPDGYEETDPGDVFDEVYEDINAVKDMISDEYDTTATYNVGDFCIHENALYKCTATATGLWDSSKWVLTSASDETKANTAAISAMSEYEPNDITNRLSDLTMAISEGNLSKYGYKIGDYFIGASGYKYWLADLNTFYGGFDDNAVFATKHLAIVVDSGEKVAWHTSGDISSLSYKDCNLQLYLQNTVMPNINSDIDTLFGQDHILTHKMLSANIGSWGWTSGVRSISGLSEVNVYGCPIFSVDKFQQGEECTQLEIFRKYKYNKLFGANDVWLRSIASSTQACFAGKAGNAGCDTVTLATMLAVGLILLH